jgi:tetratricopeptide (TPR) repeat protein
MRHEWESLTEVFHKQIKECAYDRALAAAREAFQMAETALGPSHPEVATCMLHVADGLRIQNRHLQAEPFYKLALMIREKAFGADDLAVAPIHNNLGLLYGSMRRFDLARDHHHRALGIREGALGPNHTDVAQSLNNLGMLLDDQFLHDEAEPLYLRALAISENAANPENPETATFLNNLGVLYYEVGKYVRAERCVQRSLRILETTLGPAHPTVAISLETLATLCRVMDRDAEAAALRIRAANIRSLGA